MHTLFIKNMVCERCISTVQKLVEHLELTISKITLGEVKVEEQPTSRALNALEIQLKAQGFELLKSTEQQLISSIKKAVLTYVELLEPTENLSDYLRQTIGKEYSVLSKLFSQVEERTIENYFIALRIEKAKEYITYAELSLSEIAYKLHFSNVAHLSAQFKKVTGMTPSSFKKLGSAGRKGLEKV